jgi:hypothetical protein
MKTKLEETPTERLTEYRKIKVNTEKSLKHREITKNDKSQDKNLVVTSSRF